MLQCAGSLAVSKAQTNPPCLPLSPSSPALPACCLPSCPVHLSMPPSSSCLTYAPLSLSLRPHTAAAPSAGVIDFKRQLWGVPATVRHPPPRRPVWGSCLCNRITAAPCRHGLSFNRMALITSDCGTTRSPAHQMALITSGYDRSSGWSTTRTDLLSSRCWNTRTA